MYLVQDPLTAGRQYLLGQLGPEVVAAASRTMDLVPYQATAVQRGDEPAQV